MAAIWSMEIPSGSTGEIYVVTAFDNDTTVCTCRFGSMKGPIPVGQRACKHARQALQQRVLGYSEEVLPVAYRDDEVGFDRAAWVRHFCWIFSPVDHVKEVVAEILRVDNDHVSRAKRRDEGETRLRPHPLPPQKRAIVELLLDALEDFEQDSNNEANELARTVLEKVLEERRRDGLTNVERARAIHSVLSEET